MEIQERRANLCEKDLAQVHAGGPGDGAAEGPGPEARCPGLLRGERPRAERAGRPDRQPLRGPQLGGPRFSRTTGH